MDDKPASETKKITKIPSLLDLSRTPSEDTDLEGTERLFYTCPQCGHAMVTKKCKIVCRVCHYFIGCSE